MFFLLNCLDKRILKNTKEINIRREKLIQTINRDIRYELDEAKNNKCKEIISKIIEFVEDILSSHANYRLSLELGE